jgi:RHH-type rel operon transcriptional repressor/antitoxin RelB
MAFLPHARKDGKPGVRYRVSRAERVFRRERRRNRGNDNSAERPALRVDEPFPSLYSTAINTETSMLTLRLPVAIEKRLNRLAKRTGRSKSFHAQEAILHHLDDLEDLRCGVLSATKRA